MQQMSLESVIAKCDNLFYGNPEAGIEVDYKTACRFYHLVLKKYTNNEEHENSLLAHVKTQLGICYLNGLGVNADLNKAISYFQEAANEGNKKSIQSLQHIGLFNKQITTDELEAYWLIKAEWEIFNVDVLHSNYIFPLEIWKIILHYLNPEKDGVPLMLVCKHLLQAVKSYDWEEHKNFYYLYLNRMTELYDQARETLFNFATKTDTGKSLISSLNVFLHGLFAFPILPISRRDDILNGLEYHFTHFETWRINASKKAYIQKISEIKLFATKDRYYSQNDFPNKYNKFVHEHHHDDTFQIIILDLLELLRRVKHFYSVSPLRLFSLKKESDKKNEIAISLKDTGLNLTSQDKLTSLIIDRDGDMPFCCNCFLSCDCNSLNSNAFFIQNFIQIFTNILLTFPYFLQPYQGKYNQYYSEMRSINCNLPAVEIPCSQGKEIISTSGNCTNSFSIQNVHTWPGESSETCKIYGEGSYLSTNPPAGYFFTSLIVSFCLAISLHLFHREVSEPSYLSRLITKTICAVLSLGFAGLNLALPYLAQTGWADSKGYNTGCSVGCFLNEEDSGNFSSNIYNEAITNFNPIYMGLITTAIIIFLNPRHYNIFRNNRDKENFTKKTARLGENRYGTFANPKLIEPINEIDIEIEEKTDSEGEYEEPTWTTGCNLF